MYRITKNNGFSLLELMIVVAIIAIIASVAYPSYTDSVRKGHRNDGQAVLLDIAARQEAFYARNATYTSTLSELNATNRSPERYYRININSADATSYMITASALPKGGQNQDSIRKFRLHSNGERQFRGSTGPWRDGWIGY